MKSSWIAEQSTSRRTAAIPLTRRQGPKTGLVDQLMGRRMCETKEGAQPLIHRWIKGLTQPELGLVLSALILFELFNDSFEHFRDGGIWWISLTTIFASALCIVAPGPRRDEIHKSVRLITLTISFALGLYTVAAQITYPIGLLDDNDQILHYVDLSVVIAVLASIFSFWRPAFVLVPCATVLQQKSTAAYLFDIDISHTDYIPLLEMGLFLGIALMLMGPGLPKRLGAFSRMIKRCDPTWAFVLIFMAAVSAHFSNYVYSGMQKLLLDGGPFLWVFSNPTYILSANSFISGYVPIGSFPELTYLMIATLEVLWPVMNVVILLAQLGALVFVFRRATLIGATLFYDLTHVVIFIISGIMFWKWVLLNSALVAAMRYLPAMAERRTSVVLSIFVVLAAPETFHIVRLGWYDTPAMARTEIIAVTNDGKEHLVPSNFFGSISITAAQHRLGRLEPNVFPTVTLGTTQNSLVFQQAWNDCTFDSETALTPYQVDEDRLKRLLQVTHTYALQQSSGDGRYNYDFFPHHIWSNPWLFRDFAELDPKSIVTYVYRTIFGCISVKEGHPTEDVRKINSLMIPALDLVENKNRTH
jgi:hypothetical protein